MKNVSRLHFEPGTIYLFTVSRKDRPERGLYGLFDCLDRGRIKLEAVQIGPCDLRYGEYLPQGYRYARKAKKDEIRDFCYLHGYDRCRIERMHASPIEDWSAYVPDTRDVDIRSCSLCEESF